MDVNALDVVPYPHPALRWTAKPINVTPLVQDVARKMTALMYDYRGVGLAANQVAIPWRMFVTCVHNQERVFINPTITVKTGKKLFVPDYPEACLSLPGLHLIHPAGEYPIRRNLNIEVTATDIDGNIFTVSREDLLKDDCLLARCILHENDHLNGVLFVDYVPVDSPDRDVRKIREHADKWLLYLKAQYEFLPEHGKLALNRFENDEVERQKLLSLEQVMYT
jgi:peptide deformylase